MKKFILYFILSFLPMVTLAQKDTTHSKTKGIIKIYPLQAIVGEIRLGYEQPLTKHLSVEVSPGYVFGIIGGEYDGDLGPSGKSNLDMVKGFALRARIKYYITPKKEYMSEFYLSPLFLYKRTNSGFNSAYFPYSYVASNYSFYGVQVLAGYKFNTKFKLIFEPYMGFGIQQSYYKRKEKQAQYRTIHVGCSIGYKITKK